MTNIIYQIQFYSDWHCSSGLTAGADVDSLVIKDEKGLPYIPGKTLKGLFREAAQNIYELKENSQEWKDFIEKNFGKEGEKKDFTKLCFFSDAQLTQNLQSKLVPEGKPTGKSRVLYRKLSSTAIEANGQAKEKSLRKMEVTIPLTLFATINNCNDKEKMALCLKWVKELGTNRNRGLGRCDIVVKELKQ